MLSQKVGEGKLWKLMLLTSVFVGSLVIANVIVAKIIAAFWGLYIPAGVIAYSITFLCTDTIEEVWGKGTAKIVVWCGFIAQIVALILTLVAIHWPAAPFWKNQEAYVSVLGMMPRVVLASMVAYLVSQHHDVFAFNFWKRITHGKHLWLRNNASTMVSQFLDSAVFVTIAFIGVTAIWPLILGQFVSKVVIAACDTPFCYWLVSWAKK